MQCRDGHSLISRTVLSRTKPPAGQLEEGGAQLKEQNVRVVVLVHKQHRIHGSSDALLGIPAGEEGGVPW